MPAHKQIIDGHKPCTKCNDYLPVTKFGTDKKTIDGLHSWCLDCRRKDAKRWFNNNHVRAKSSRWSWKIRSKYGISPDDYANLLKKQDNSCAICNGNPGGNRTHFDVDHCHKSGKICGLLCRNCNTSIGRLHDRIDYIENLLEYLTGNFCIQRVNLDFDEPKINAQKRADLKRRFAITEEEYLNLWRRQYGLCAVCRDRCKTGRPLVVDHSHDTSRIRGLLCRSCNLVAGTMRDNIATLERMRLYLVSFSVYLKIISAIDLAEV